MAFPQLLAGKVAAVTGGLTGIGRVSDMLFLKYERMKLVIDASINYRRILVDEIYRRLSLLNTSVTVLMSLLITLEALMRRN